MHMSWYNQPAIYYMYLYVSLLVIVRNDVFRERWVMSQR